MSRVAQTLKTKVIAAVVVLVILGGGLVTSIYIHNKNSGHVHTTANSQNQINQISYDGKNGVNAYVLLQKYASVKAQHYSFGYLVTSIDGVNGNGPKYWTFYVNGKEASVGASSYITKSSDKISWKLQ